MYFYNVDITTTQYCFISALFTPNQRLQDFLDKKKNNLKPIFLVEDLTNPKTKKTAYRSLKPFSGIFMVVTIVTGQFYVSRAVTGDIICVFSLRTANPQRGKEADPGPPSFSLSYKKISSSSNEVKR